MTWVADYVGLPYKDRGRTLEGCDCWGLVALVQQAVFGRRVPRYDEYLTAEDRHEISQLMLNAAPGWERIEPGKERVGDIIQLRIGKTPCHAGTVLRPGWMLHIQKDLNAVVEPYTAMRWRSRVVGFWRGYNGPGDA